MGFWKNYRQRRVSLTGPESIETLSAMEWFFQGGENWTKGAYHRRDGSKCLVGAAQSMRTAAIEDARYWVRQAIAERQGAPVGLMGIEGFNDSRGSYTEIAAVLARAKQLAAARQSPAPVAEILPPDRLALTHQPESELPTIKVTLADLERVNRRAKSTGER
jgi:hypothetical protein